MFWPFGHHMVLTQFTFSFSSSAAIPYIGQCFYLGIIFSLLYANVLCSLFVKIYIQNIKTLMLRCQIGSLIFLVFCGLWMLNNDVFVLGLARRYKVSVFLPLYDVGWCFIFFVVSVLKSIRGFTSIAYSPEALLPSRLPGTNLKVTAVQWVIKIPGVIEKEQYMSSGLQEQVK
jgi:hypothetical protein